MAKMTVKDVDVRSKRVLVRVDYNVPLDANGNVSDDKRRHQERAEHYQHEHEYEEYVQLSLEEHAENGAPVRIARRDYLL